MTNKLIRMLGATLIAAACLYGLYQVSPVIFKHSAMGMAELQSR